MATLKLKNKGRAGGRRKMNPTFMLMSKSNNGNSKATERSRLEEVQIEIDSIVGTMRGNVEKVLERDIKLGDLEDKTEQLKDGAQRFSVTSKRLKQRMWWNNCQSTTCLVLVVLCVLIIVGVILGVTLSN